MLPLLRRIFVWLRRPSYLLDESLSGSESIKYSCLVQIKNFKGFKIASLNINRLLTHIDELRLILSKSDIDVFAINETKIDNYSKISIPGYTVGIVIDLGMEFLFIFAKYTPFLNGRT